MTLISAASVMWTHKNYPNNVSDKVNHVIATALHMYHHISVTLHVVQSDLDLGCFEASWTPEAFSQVLLLNSFLGVA